MSFSKQVLIAGFGGQGVLFTGKFIAYNGLFEDREVSWLPSYGPEARGGTSNCSIIVSDDPIGSPIVTNPDILIAMNLPSLDKFEDSVVPGGKIFIDSSLIERKVNRTDVEVYYVPATQIASDEKLSGSANMILLGSVLKNTDLMPYENVSTVMQKLVPAKRQNLIELNEKAIALGYNY